jgi:hypothetical protein
VVERIFVLQHFRNDGRLGPHVLKTLLPQLDAAVRPQIKRGIRVRVVDDERCAHKTVFQTDDEFER